MNNQANNPKAILKKRCVKFSLDILKLSDEYIKDFTIRTIFKQLIRSATSIGANVVEVTGAGSKKDFINFFTIALKSAGETQYWLYLIIEARKDKSEKIKILLDEACQIGKMLSSSIITAKGNR